MRRTIALAALVLTASAGIALARGRYAEQKLYLSGKVASSNVIMQNGAAYVPIKDVAAALDMTIEKRPDGFALTRSGGANQAEGMQGKVGDDLFNGQVRLKVSEVFRGSSYKRRFSKGDDIVAPDGQDIVAVVMRFKNGTMKSQFPNVTGKQPTGLTDENEHAFEPRSFPDGTGRNVELLPGAATDFALIFTVPKGAALKDLVYTVDCGILKPSTFRVSLKDASGK